MFKSYNTQKFELATSIVSSITGIALIATITAIFASAATYFVTGIEMLWLIRTGMILSVVAVALFVATLAMCAIAHIMDERVENSDDCE